MQRLLVFLFSILLTVTARAEDPVRVAIYSYTRHFTVSDVNDHHPMVQFEYRRQWTGGVFLNSGRNWSWYGARRFQHHGPGRPFVEIGAVTGYSAPVVRTVRIGVEINENLDIVILPGFASDYSWRVVDAVSVAAVVVKF